MSNLIQRFNYSKAQNSPWGKVDSVTKYCVGLSRVNTPRHGGLRITERLLRQHACDVNFLLSRAIKMGNYLYFEEDCDAQLLLFDCPRLLQIVAANSGRNAEQLFQDCKKSVERWNPDYFLNTEKGA